MRITLIIAVAIMTGPPLAYGSPACMTQSEARAKFPKATIFIRANIAGVTVRHTVFAHSPQRNVAIRPGLFEFEILRTLAQ